MKLITLNFNNWDDSTRGGKLRRVYHRIRYKGYKWTPFVTVEFKII